MMPTSTGPDAETMRAAMSHFGSGVTVVTGIAGDEPVGFACQSFASVSLRPPLVLFCADHRGRAWPKIRSSGRFTVNVLAADQVDLCMAFGSRTGTKFEDVAWSPGPSGCPVLPDVLVAVHARVEHLHVEGDHDVVIGRVESIEVGRSDAEPLLFYRSSFGTLRDTAATAAPATDGSSLDPVTWAWDDHWW